MSGWIKYDGTNKPDDNALVLVSFANGIEFKEYEKAGGFAWHDDFTPSEMYGFLISHFQLKEKRNDRL